MPTAIPPSTRPFFQEYNFLSLDSQANAPLVMERLLAYGNRAEVRWLFQEYGKERLKAWVRQAGVQRLPRKRYHFFCLILDLTPNLENKSRIWAY